MPHQPPLLAAASALTLAVNLMLLGGCGGGGGGGAGETASQAESGAAASAATAVSGLGDRAVGRDGGSATSVAPAPTTVVVDPGAATTGALASDTPLVGVDMAVSTSPDLSTSLLSNPVDGETVMNLDLNAAAAPAVTVAQTAVSQGTAAASAQVAALSRLPGVLLPARVATEDWTSARQLALASTQWKGWVAGQREQVTRWFATPRDRADLVAGLPNDFVDPVSGAALTWTVDTPMPASGTTPAQLRLQQAWVAINRQSNIARALDAARLYRLTGDAAFAEHAARQLDFYAAHYLAWPLRTGIGNARMLGQSLDEAISALTLLDVVRTLNDYPSPARLSSWRDGLFLPIAANVQTYGDSSLNNINLWCAAAVAAIGIQFNDQSLVALGINGPKGIGAVMNQSVTADGIWAEGSFAYNNYVLAALARFFDQAALNGRADLVTRFIPATQRMLLAPLLFRFQDGTLPKPSDTRFAVAPVDLETHLALYRHVPTSFGAQKAGSTYSWATLLDAPPAITSTPALPTVETMNAEGARMALLRSGTWQVFVHYGQTSANHAQAEALSYELMEGTNAITRDAGTATSYSLPQHLVYFSQGLGNNVPLVDGQGQQQWAAGSLTAFDPAAGRLDVTHSNYRAGVHARRSYQVTSSGFSETTRITVSGTQPAARRLGVMLNTACPVTLTDRRAGIPASSSVPFANPGYAYWSGITRQQAVEGTWSAELKCGTKTYLVTVSGPAGHSIYRAKAPDTPLPATRNAMYVEAMGTDVSFTTSYRVLP